MLETTGWCARAGRRSKPAALAGIVSFTALTLLLTAQTVPPSEGTKQIGPPPGMGSVERLDATHGFRGLKFGEDMPKGLTLYQDRGALKLYTRKGDKLALGPAQLEQIVYYSLNDKFYGVSLYTEDGRDSNLLLRIAELAFGRGATEGQPGTQYFWQGREANARYTRNPATGQAELFIGTNKMTEAYHEYEAKAIYEAAKEL